MTQDTPLPHAPTLTPTSSLRMKGLAIAYALFLATVVVVADSGDYKELFGFVDSIPMGDKLGHLVFMGVLAVVVCAAVPRLRKRALGVVPWGSVAVFVVVALEEISQAWFPSRSCDILDLTADVIGIGLASLVIAWTWPSAAVSVSSSALSETMPSATRPPKW